MTGPDELSEVFDQRRLYCGMDCTLDGEPAVISGSRNDYAAVAMLSGRVNAEYSWDTVARIMKVGGGFTY